MSFREKLQEFADSAIVNNFIIVVVFINAITLGLETSEWMRQHFGLYLIIIDHIALYIFTCEIILKFIAHPSHYFRDPWNIFDFLIVGIAYLPATGAFSVLRSLRILRILLFISFMPRLRIIVRSLLLALPSIGWISLLMGIVFYIFAVIATTIFGSKFPAWFGTLGESFYTLFQIMTLESWSMGIARPIIEEFPYAWLFFIPFVLLSAFVILNVFIAIIINGMQDAKMLQENEAVKGYDKNTLDIKNELKLIRESLERIETEYLKLESENVSAKK